MVVGRREEHSLKKKRPQSKVEQHTPRDAWPKGSLVISMRTLDTCRPPVLK